MAVKRTLVIIGAGGFGREVHAWAMQSEAFGRDWTIKGFIDDNIDALRARPSPGKIIGRISDYAPASDNVFVCAIGVPAIKRKCSVMIAERGGVFTTVIHRTVVMAHEVSLGHGVIACPFVVLSANVVIGDGVGLNLHASVDHDAEVGAWSQVNCHGDLTGGVVLDEEVFLGSHASVLPGVRVGRGAVIGAGAVVLQDVPAGVTVAGVPARPLRVR
jgi:sugar O-acyltransferase (sialic acid O-acetyltransferase NeuD family)